ncbi:MAG: hypothetical protein A3I05_06600 [Deltaproteobacteria bacterium RIFCSPLOWO2_02_FULL_44_10]|nr:MAG: hypothetical protein A3C46_06800 [Deltaproteobacteria bacterium RIFCSPHIGHO2_02_FULL_44_16]OGQ46701.1 MAG: hypothetical protein A3I05_06600 [Deltaproteobacteria bacterium RIFCSPLOWO2_02_FULL_44_10]
MNLDVKPVCDRIPEDGHGCEAPSPPQPDPDAPKGPPPSPPPDDFGNPTNTYSLIDHAAKERVRHLGIMNTSLS